MAEYRVMLIEDTQRLFDETHEHAGKMNNIYKNLWAAQQQFVKELTAITKKPERLYTFFPSPCVVALTDDDNVIGFISLSPQLKQGILLIGHCWVDPRCRKQGVYKLMLRRVCKMVDDIEKKELNPYGKLDKICVGIDKKNNLSKKAHNKLGFNTFMIWGEIDPVELIKKIGYKKE